MGAFVVMAFLIAGLAVALLLLGSRDREAVQANERLLSRQERAELDGRRDLDERLKDLAWDHRDIAPELATIVLDEIRSFERQQRRGLEP